MKSKVLHLIKSLGRGGAEMLLPETIRHHDKDRFEFHCIYFLPWKDQLVPDLQVEGVKVMCVSAKNNLHMLTRTRALVRYVQENGIDLIHCHLPWAGILGRIVHRLTGVPVVYTEHNSLERYHYLTRLMNRLTLGWNNRVIAVSEDVAISVRKYKGHRFDVITLPNGIDTDKYAPSSSTIDAREMLKWPVTGPVIGNVCVFRIQKRLSVWLELAARISKEIPTASFILVGDGPLNREVRETISGLGLENNILMAGLQQDVRPYLSAMDLFMITSQFEGLPLALLEAMSMEVPVIATAAGGIPEVIENEVSGRVVPVDQPDQLYDIALDLLRNPDRQREMGAAGRVRVNKFYSIQHMVRELEKLYNILLEEKR